MAKDKETKQKPPSHIQSTAFELIKRNGPRTVAMIAHQFLNVGNLIAGDSLDAQWSVVEAEIQSDPRLVKVADNPGIGGDWFGLKGDDNADG